MQPAVLAPSRRVSDLRCLQCGADLPEDLFSRFTTWARLADHGYQPGEYVFWHPTGWLLTVVKAPLATPSQSQSPSEKVRAVFCACSSPFPIGWKPAEGVPCVSVPEFQAARLALRRLLARARRAAAAPLN